MAMVEAGVLWEERRRESTAVLQVSSNLVRTYRAWPSIAGSSCSLTWLDNKMGETEVTTQATMLLRALASDEWQEAAPTSVPQSYRGDGVAQTLYRQSARETGKGHMPCSVTMSFATRRRPSKNCPIFIAAGARDECREV